MPGEKAIKISFPCSVWMLRVVLTTDFGISGHDALVRWRKLMRVWCHLNTLFININSNNLICMQEYKCSKKVLMMLGFINRSTGNFKNINVLKFFFFWLGYILSLSQPFGHLVITFSLIILKMYNMNSQSFRVTN